MELSDGAPARAQRPGRGTLSEVRIVGVGAAGAPVEGGAAGWAMELLMGLEPMTSSLPRRCSTTELQQPTGLWIPASGGLEGNGRVRVERAMGIEPT